MRTRTRYSLLVAIALLAALVAAVILRKAAPPEAARLLPESDAILYINLRPLRSATHFDRTAVTRDADFQQFIDATGIVPERDLDVAAFALHRMADPRGPNGPVAYSEVFEGRFDGARLGKYLAGLATSQEQYAEHTIYTIPIEGRQFRIAQLGYDTIAASNMPTTEQIHVMLDRYRASASPFSGSSLLAERYRDVPLLSAAWGIGRVGLPFAQDGRVQLFGLSLPLAADSTFVASLRYGIGALHLRVEQITQSEQEAAQSTAALDDLAKLVQTMQPAIDAQADDKTAKQMLAFTSSIKVEQHKERVVLTASVPVEVVRKLALPPNTSDAMPAAH